MTFVFYSYESHDHITTRRKIEGMQSSGNGGGGHCHGFCLQKFQIKAPGDAPACVVARLRGHTRAVLSLDSDPRFLSHILFSKIFALIAIAAGCYLVLPTRLFNSGRQIGTNCNQVEANTVLIRDYQKPTREAQQHGTANHSPNPHTHWPLHEGIRKKPFSDEKDWFRIYNQRS